MKIGIYSICKNEEANFANWWNNVKDADEVFVLDTGSTDGTLSLLQEKFTESLAGDGSFRYNYYGDRPFEFDIARNMSVQGLMWGAKTKVDYAVWVDFDETFPDGWIDELRKVITTMISSGAPVPHSIQFNNRFEDSDSSWYQSRAHAPKAYYWKYSAHEVMLFSEDIEELEVIASCDITITHPNKEVRNDYTTLLLESHNKYADGRTSYYLGREYYYNREWENASKYLRECLYVHNGWQAERGEAAKMLADLHRDEPLSELKYLHFYLAYCNLQREPYLELARYYYDREQWEACIVYATQALEIDKPSSYLVLNEACYTSTPHDLLTICYDKLGDKVTAAYHAGICLQYDPANQRYRDNVQYYINEGVLRFEQDSTKTDGNTGGTRSTSESTSSTDED